MIEELPNLISNYGFPIAVCVYLLWKDYAVSQKQIVALDSIKDTMSEGFKTVELALANRGL